MEDRFKRISKKTKEVICGKLLLGIPTSEVAKQMALDVHEKVDRDVLREDVRRLAKKVTPKTDTMHLREEDAMMQILKKPEIRKFNYDQFIENLEEQLSEEEREKYIPTPDNRFLLIRISDYQLYLFNENPYNLEVDGTHKLNHHDLTTITMTVFDHRGEGKLICTGLYLKNFFNDKKFYIL